jgi:hypothetical protein
MDVDYDENDRPILPSLLDIIKSYSEAKKLQQENEPMVAIGGDPLNVIDFPRANPPKKPTITSPVNDKTTANDNIFPAPTSFQPPNPTQVSGAVNGIDPSTVDNEVSGGEPAAFSRGIETAQTDETSAYPRQKVGT